MPWFDAIPEREIKPAPLGVGGQITDQSMNARMLEQNIRELRDRIQPDTSEVGPWLKLAEQMGGAVYRVNAKTGEDTAISHSLGRVPRAVVQSTALDGLGGEVLGSPGGSPNTRPWTRDTIYVRGSRDAPFVIVVV